MAGTPAATDQHHYACQCLNIRIRLTEAQSIPTDFVKDPDFIHVFAGEDGIVVVREYASTKVSLFHFKKNRSIPKLRCEHGCGGHQLLGHPDIPDIRLLLVYFATCLYIASTRRTPQTLMGKMAHFCPQKIGLNATL